MAELAGAHGLFIGTYTKGKSEGIYALGLDRASGWLGEPRLAAKAPNPTFLALSADRALLYAVCANPSWLSSFRVDAEGLRLTPIHQESAGTGPTPCHVTIEAAGRFALAANYHLGKAALVPLGGDGTVGVPAVIDHRGRGPHPARQTIPHVHSTYFSPDGRLALVCDLGLDKVYAYAVDRKTPALVPSGSPYVQTASGAGPRHLALAPSGRTIYVVNELDCTIVGYAFDAATGSMKPGAAVSLLPPGYKGEPTAAEVAVHPNGRFVYGSCRGPDTISVFSVGAGEDRLSLVESVPCGGKGPRSFSLSPGGGWLVCAHQDSDSLCSFRVDPATGRLERVAGTVSVPMPVCVAFLN